MESWSVIAGRKSGLSLLRASFGRLNSHRPEGDGISALLDGGDAVFPDPPGFALHHVERTRRRIQGETLPFVAGCAAKPKLAGSPQGQPEDLVEVRLVAVPSDADTDIVLRAQDLADAFRRQMAKGFDGACDRRQPGGNRISLRKPLERVVVAIAERRH